MKELKMFPITGVVRSPSQIFFDPKSYQKISLIDEEKG